MPLLLILTSGRYLNTCGGCSYDTRVADLLSSSLRKDLVFWSDVQFKILIVAHLNGSKLTTLVSTNITTPGIIVMQHSAIILPL